MSSQSKPAEPVESLEQRLNSHPELKARIEALLLLVENSKGNIVKASDAEQRVVEEIRQMGQTALQSWANRQNRQQGELFSREHPSAHRGGKKNSIGIADSDALK